MSSEDEFESNSQLPDEDRPIMSKEEIELRDSINDYLSSRHYHLRLSYLNVRKTEYIHDFVQPIDKWFNEFPAVYSIVNKKIHEWQDLHFTSR